MNERPVSGADNLLNAFIFALMAIVFCAFPIAEYRLPAPPEKSFAVGAVVGPVLLLFLIMLYACTAFGTRAKLRQNPIFEGMILSVFLELTFSAVASLFMGRPDMAFLLRYVTAASEIAGALYWLAFWFFAKSVIAKPEKNKGFFIFLDCLVGAYVLFFIVVTLLSVFRDVYFTVDAAGYVSFDTGYARMFSTLFKGLLLAFLLRVFCSHEKWRVKWALGSYVLFPAVYCIFEMLSEKWEMLTPAMWLADVALVVSLYIIFFNEYTERGNRMLVQEKALTESRLNSMILQINPHFIYNTLGSIAALCRINPGEAEELTLKFADYLRDNDKNLVGRPMIPFKEELTTLQHYLSIEQVRFPNIEVVYRIDAEEFSVPSLSVQPLVENAIKHGICKRRRAKGKIVISSGELADAFVIRIMDDGVGFDKLPKDNKQHIGISNVRARLSMLCDGTLTVESIPDEGTVCEIIIPKKKETEV